MKKPIETYYNWDIYQLDIPYYGNDYAADYWTGFIYDSPVKLFSKTIEDIKIQIDEFNKSKKTNEINDR